MRYPTRSIGDSTLHAGMIACIGPCRLVSVCGYSDADRYLMIFEAAAVPANGSKAKFSFPVDGGRAYAFQMPAPIDLDACSVAFSSTIETYTQVVGAVGSIQVQLAG